MKTPREILLSRHRSAEPKLDALREETVAAVCDRRDNERINFWRELILPRPRAWAGLATAWVVILVLKLSTHDQSHGVASQSSMPPEVVAELQQQKHLYTELAGLPQLPDVKSSKPFLPRPRS